MLGQLLVSYVGVNSRGQVTSGRYGATLNTSCTYDNFGFPMSVITGSLQNMQYQFNPVTGNLNQRSNGLITNLQENFDYDALDRLDRIYKGSNTLLDMTYSESNMIEKTDLGTMEYLKTGKPYQLSGIDPSAGLTPNVAQSISYTSFESVKTIVENGYSADFDYNADIERAKMTISQNGTEILTRIYASDRYIKETSGGLTKEYTFIGGDAYTAPAVAVKQNGSEIYYYLLRDHLGSITQVVNANTNLTVAEYSYDAWGRMRDSATWENYSPGSEPVLMIAGRGYTGHEHLPWFNLINMNGRLYDPLTAQFLSPDNYVQAPTFSLSYNRYIYCLNNPLKYTDPSGEKWWNILGDILSGGAISQAVLTTTATLAPFASEWGYQIQKYISPVAIKLDLSFGSIQNGLGFDLSYGMLKGAPGYRGSFGATYYYSNYGGFNGWEKRIGGEVEILPLLSYSGTTFIDGESSQSTNRITFGDPFTFISYENDTEMPFNFFGVPKHDGGDRYRTASARISVGGLEIGLNLHTGMAGGDGYDSHKIDLDGDGIPDTWVFYGGSIDEPTQRAGVLYVGFGPIRIGSDSESIRHTFQNKFAHDYINGGSHGSEYSWVLPINKKPSFF